MSLQREAGICQDCGRCIVEKNVPSATGNIVACVLTLGIWVWVYGPLLIVSACSGWRCSQCGRKSRTLTYKEMRLDNKDFQTNKKFIGANKPKIEVHDA